MTEAERTEAQTELENLKGRAREIEARIAETQNPQPEPQPANMAELAQRFPVLNRR